MYESQNKTDLMIEVWESLDCESIGAAELIAIEDAVRASFGNAAVDSPMAAARLLADEGAELRHDEILRLFVDRNAKTLHDAALRNIVDIGDLQKLSRSIDRMENLRRRYSVAGDKEGLRLLRQKAIKFKDIAHELSVDSRTSPNDRLLNAEIAEWLTIWLQTPELFGAWAALRIRSAEFREWFGEEGQKN